MNQVTKNIIGRQPPVASDPLQVSTRKVIEIASRPGHPWSSLMMSNPAVIDPITLIEVAELPLLSSIGFPGQGWDQDKFHGACAVLFFRFPQFFESADFTKMADILTKHVRERHAEGGAAAIRWIDQYLQLCIPEREQSMGQESLIGWNSTLAILFRRGGYISQLLELHKLATEKMLAPA